MAKSRIMGKIRRMWTIVALFVGIMGNAAGVAVGAQESGEAGNSAEVTKRPEAVVSQRDSRYENMKKYRELYVPTSELNVILEAAPQRVMVARSEFDSLVEKIRKLDELEETERNRLVAPLDSVLTESRYEVRIEDGQTRIMGTLRFDRFRNEAIAVPVTWSGVSLIDAVWDDQPAAWVTLESGERFLILPATRDGTTNGGDTTSGESANRETNVPLRLTFAAALETTAVLQTLRCTLPEAVVRRVTLEAPGDVEMKRGAAVVSRNVLENMGDTENTEGNRTAGMVTRFEILPEAVPGAERGRWEMTLTLNSHTRRGGIRSVARSVQVAEVTRGYQRLYATVSVQVLRQAQQRFRFVLPESFEADSVELIGSMAPADDETATATLSAWRMVEPVESRIVEAELREPAIGTLVFGITAVRSGTRELPFLTDERIAAGDEPERWEFPAILPIGTESHSGVLGLICEDQINPYRMVTRNLIPIDMAILEKAIPSSALASEPGLPVVRSVAAYYAPIAGCVADSGESNTVGENTANNVGGDTADRTTDHTTNPTDNMADNIANTVEGETTGTTRDAAWAFSTGFRRPAEELLATTRVFLEPGTNETRLRANVVLISTREKIFDTKIDLPAGWNVVRMTETTADGTGERELRYEPLTTGERENSEVTSEEISEEISEGTSENRGGTGGTRLRIVPGTAIEERTAWAFSIDAVATPELRDDSADSAVLAFPEITIVDATRVSGVIAVGCDGDYSVRPEADPSESLIPMSESEAISYCRTDGVTPQLAWSYHQRTVLPRILVEKKKTRCTARAFSFFRVEQDRIAAHWELIWKIDQARTSQLRFSLPCDAPEGVTIRAADDSVAIRQYTSSVEEGDGGKTQRVWVVETETPVIGTVRLMADFSIPQAELSVAQTTKRTLPLPLFPDAAHLSGLVAVEGDAELETGVLTPARKVDIGELAEAQSYQPGDRLIGAWSFVADPPEFQVQMRRYPTLDLTAAIAEELRLDLQMTDHEGGIQYIAAEFVLRTAPQNLLLELPRGAQLYAIHLDDHAKRPAVANQARGNQTQGNRGGKNDAKGMDNENLGPVYLVDVTPVAGGDGTAESAGNAEITQMDRRILRIVYGVPRTAAGDGTMVEGIGRLSIEVPRMRLADGRVMPVLYARGRILPPKGTRILKENEYESNDGTPPIVEGGFVQGTERVLRDLKEIVFGKDEASRATMSCGCSATGFQEDALATKANSTSTLATGTASAGMRTDDAAVGLDAVEEMAEVYEYAPSMDADMSEAVAMNRSEDKKANLSEETAKEGETESLLREESPPVPAAPVVEERRRKAEVAAGEKRVVSQSPRRDVLTGIRSLPIQMAMDSGEEWGSVVEIAIPTMDGTEGDAKTEKIAGKDGTARTSETANVGPLVRTEVVYVREGTLRFGAMEWIVGLGVLIGGIGLLRKSYFAQCLYLVIVWIVAAGFPMGVRFYDTFVYHRTVGTLCAGNPGHVAFVRGMAAAMAAAVTLLMVVYLCRIGWNGGRAMLRAGMVRVLARRSKAKAKAKAKAEAESEGGAIPTEDMENTSTAETTGETATAGRSRSKTARWIRRGIFWGILFVVLWTLWMWWVKTSTAQEPVLPPVVIPEDAIVVPYELEAETTGTAAVVRPERTAGQTLFVPYTDYQTMVERLRERMDQGKDDERTAKAPVTLRTAAGEVRDVAAAIRNTEYSVSVGTEETLAVRGTFEVEIFARRGDIVVPLPVAGAMIESVEVDGNPAALVTLAATIPGVFAQQMATQAVANSMATPEMPNATVGVRISGQGVHAVAISLRFRISRQGGIRTISGIVPIGAAAQLNIEVPTAGTTLSVGDESRGNTLRETHQTTVDNQRIVTSLDTAAQGPVVVAPAVPGSPAIQCGRFRVQWRPKVITDTPIDAGLTVDSLSVIDFSEEGTRMAWKATPAFRSGEYTQFQVEIPLSDLPDAQQWRVERVTGANVRVWDQRVEGQRMVIDIELLGAAVGTETFIVTLFQPTTNRRTVPIPTLSGSLRHTGAIAVRRSPRLSLQPIQFAGTEQIDAPPIPDEMVELGETPLGMNAFPQGYQFRSHPAPLVFDVNPPEENMAMVAETELRVTPTETVVDATIRVERYDGVPFHEFTLELPPGLRVDAVTATSEIGATIATPDGVMEPVSDTAKRQTLDAAWRIVSEEIDQTEVADIKERWLTPGDRLVFRFSQACTSPFLIHLEGTFYEPKTEPDHGVAWLLPWFYTSQTTRVRITNTLIIQTDPAFETTWHTVGKRAELGADAWQTAGERRSETIRNRLSGERLTTLRNILECVAQPNEGTLRPSGVVRLTPRTPIVDATLLTNVKLTDRDVEETLLVDLAIERAGLREVELILPERMGDARFQVPGLRRTAIEPIDGTTDILVRLELQDAVMGRVRVLIENDLPLAQGVRDVVFPKLQTPVRTLRQFATIENSGRDEMVVAEKSGVSSIDRRQEAWTLLASLLGSEPVGAEAFEVIAQRSRGTTNTATNTAANTAAGTAGNTQNTTAQTDFAQETTTQTGVAQTNIAQTVAAQTNEPRLRIGTKRREQAAWVDARIGLSETSLIVDGFGEYRARQIWNIENSTRPLLELELPKNAVLWGVTVAGQPVKPIAGTELDLSLDAHPTNGTRVRIPLVKTSQGDPDYEIVAIYAGKLPVVSPGLPIVQMGERTAFPLVRVEGIEIRRSNVILFLPKNLHWFDFDGTLGEVDSEGELVAQRIEYRTDQLSRLIRTRRESDDPMTQIRAEENLRILTPQDSASLSGIAGAYERSSGAASFGESSSSSRSKGMDLVQKAVGNHRTIVSQVERELASVQETAPEEAAVRDNRAKLNDAFTSQSAQRSLNVVQGIVTETPGPGASTATNTGTAEASRETWAWMDRFALESTVTPPNAPSLETSTRELQETPRGTIQGTWGEAKVDAEVPLTLTPEIETATMARDIPAPDAAAPMTAPGESRWAKSKATVDSQQFLRQNKRSESLSEIELNQKSRQDGRDEKMAETEELEQTQRYRGMVQQRAMRNQMNSVGNIGNMEGIEQTDQSDGRAMNASSKPANLPANSPISETLPDSTRAYALGMAPAQAMGRASAVSEDGMDMSGGRVGGIGGPGGMGGGSYGGMMGGMGGMNGMGGKNEKGKADMAMGVPSEVPSETEWGAIALDATATRGLASLMIGWDETKLAQDSQIRYFTTPGGNLTLAARARPNWEIAAPDTLAGPLTRSLRPLFGILVFAGIVHIVAVRHRGRKRC